MTAINRRRRPRFTLVVMTLLSITVLTLDAKNVPVIGTLRSGMIEVLSPVESGFRTVTSPVRHWWSGTTDYDRVVADNKRLREENDRLKGSSISDANAVDELNRLRDQLDIPFTKDLNPVIAQVAPGRISNFDDNTVELDKGSDAGIKAGMPVVTNAGLVGRVTQVTPDHCIVRLITDSRLVVGVRLDYAVGHGAGPENPFVVDEGIELTSPIQPGAQVVTSGLTGALYPKDIPVGTVKTVSQSGSDQTQKLEVTLSADIGRLNVVQVLRWEPPK
jgi:rod shape-determining protein MreC